MSVYPFIISGELCGLHLLPVVDSVTVNISVQISFRDPAFSSFGCTRRSEIAGSCDGPIFNFVRHLQTLFPIVVVPSCSPTSSSVRCSVCFVSYCLHVLVFKISLWVTRN